MNGGCKARLAEGQWWQTCGETDMGQTAPALCTHCGGEFIRMEDMTIGDPRAEEAGKRTIDEITKDWEPIEADVPVVDGYIDEVRVTKGVPTVAAKDPGKGHFWVSMVKSGVRCLGYGIMIGVGGPVAWAGIVLLVAEVLGIVEELVD